MRAINLTLFISKLLMKIVLAIVWLICRLFGGGGPAMPSKTRLATMTDEIADAYRDNYRYQVVNDQTLALDRGQIVHDYAKADATDLRSAVDLSSLDTDQMSWLLGLSDSDLAKLTVAGPKACELAVSGRHCGVVGLPLPLARQTPTVVADKGEAVRTLLMDCIRQEHRIQPVA